MTERALTPAQRNRLEDEWQETEGRKLQRTLALELNYAMGRAANINYEHDLGLFAHRKLVEEYLSQKVEMAIKQWRYDCLIHTAELLDPLYAYQYSFEWNARGEYRFVMIPSRLMVKLLRGQLDMTLACSSSPTWEGRTVWRLYQASVIRRLQAMPPVF